MDLKLLINQIFDRACSAMRGLAGGEEIVSVGEAFGDLKDDTEIKADLVIGQEIRDLLLRVSSLRPFITVEGFPDIEGSDGDLWICVDQLDGSLDYRFRKAALGLPYSCCVTIFRKKQNACFSDIIAAGVCDYRSNDRWLALKAEESFVTFFQDRELRTDQTLELDIRNGILFAEMYYPENRELICKAFSGEKGWIRNPGSAAYEMAMVANGTVQAFICDRQKLHELGVGYALVKGSGGVAVDFSGQDLVAYPYVFNSQLPVILAANQKIAYDLLLRIKKVS